MPTTKLQLQKALGLLNLKKTGTKADLIRRLRQELKNRDHFLTDLRQMAQILGLRKGGRKAELSHRLVQFLKTEQTGGGHQGYFYHPDELSSKQRNYCACLLHTAKDQPEKKLRNKNWGSDNVGNPYAICSKSVGRDSNKCFAHYDLDGIPDDELDALMALENKDSKRELKKKWKQARREEGLEV